MRQLWSYQKESNMKNNLIEPGKVFSASMLIDGAWTTGSGTERIEVDNPSDASVIATTPAGTVSDAHGALVAATKAQPAWAALTPIQRGALVSKLADEVALQADYLAFVITLEQGKPLNQAKGEVQAVQSFLRFAAENARRIEGEITPSDNANEEIWLRRHPHGVVVGLTAWNYPAALAARKLGPALVAGNTFVLLAHEITPLSGLELARMAQKVGFPNGVFNVVTGRGPVVGQALVESPLSNLITMTGSTRAGQEIYKTGANLIKVLRLELGGKAPFIVMEDADVDAAVAAAVTARFTNCGQICTCNERMYLHHQIADEFLDKFVAQTKQLVIGDPMSNPDMGPKVSALEVNKIDAMVELGISQGAEVLLRGGALREGKFAKGHWIAPTVLEVKDNQSTLMQDEIFGPAVAAMRVSDFDEAIHLANDTSFGLSAYLFTKNMQRLMSAPSRLKFGEIYFNRTNGEQIHGFHNGWGKSGLGGEDGKYGFDGYLRKQTMYVNWS